MSPIMLFLILLLVGVFLVFCGSKIQGKGQAIFILLGGIMAALGGYGIFTVLCR